MEPSTTVIAPPALVAVLDAPEPEASNVIDLTALIAALKAERMAG